MKFKTRWSSALWMITVFSGILVLPAGYAHAYLDPGSGSFLLQILVAGFLGILFALRLFRQRISMFFKRLMGRSVEETADE